MIKNIVVLLVLMTSSLCMAQLEGYSPVESTDDYTGVWITVDSAEMTLLKDEFAPNGEWLIIYEDMSYFSSYMHPDFGATMDIEFEYTRNSHTFDCKLIGSNALGYIMEHENELFGFKLYFKLENGETRLKLINDFGTAYELVPAQ